MKSLLKYRRLIKISLMTLIFWDILVYCDLGLLTLLNMVLILLNIILFGGIFCALFWGLELRLSDREMGEVG